MRGLVVYPFLLRSNPARWVTVVLPADLSRAEIIQIADLLKLLVKPAH